MIPERLVQEYGTRTIHLNLSFNNLKSLDNLGGFTMLEEVYLDNNLLGMYDFVHCIAPWDTVCVCVCVRECVCVCERERERVCVCVRSVCL